MKRTGARISPYLTPARGRGQFYCVVDLEFDSDVCIHLLVDDIGEISGEAMLAWESISKIISRLTE